jgi:hypothetical protein
MFGGSLLEKISGSQRDLFDSGTAGGIAVQSPTTSPDGLYLTTRVESQGPWVSSGHNTLLEKPAVEK